MLRELRIENFKSWRDTGNVRLAPITGFFGANSSGKSSLFQFLRMLERSYRATAAQPLVLGSDQFLGDLLHGETTSGTVLGYALEWEQADPQANCTAARRVRFESTIAVRNGRMATEGFRYTIREGEREVAVGMKRDETRASHYALDVSPNVAVRKRDLPGIMDLPPPEKSYKFPGQVFTLYEGIEPYAWLPIAYENVMESMYFLGPLRGEPLPNYGWGGDRPRDVGEEGRGFVGAIAAMNAIAAERGETDADFEILIAEKLRQINLIHDFRVHALDAQRRNLQVRLRRLARAPEVLLTDVGFGVAQVLPVIVQCYYVPTKSIVIIEHPEAHLHPAAQADLADVLIDAVKQRKIQLIIESHSEHLLHRLQRRIAEERLASEDVALHFCQYIEDEQGAYARLTELEVDPYGNITNWPDDFFGDVMADLVAMTKAEMRRRRVAEAR